MEWTLESLHRLIRIHLRPRKESTNLNLWDDQPKVVCPICKAYERAVYREGNYVEARPLRHRKFCYWNKPKYEALLHNEEYMRGLLAGETNE